jgi:hypothetical protein
MAGVGQRNLQSRLFLLVVIAFLPAVAIYLYANRELRELQLDLHEQDLLHQARLTQVEYERLIEDSRAVLGSLAQFEEIRTGAEPGCSRVLAEVLLHAPHYTTLTVIGQDGNLACGAIPVDAALYLGDRAYFVNATTFGRFSVGNFAVGRITGKAVLGMAFPIVRGTQSGGVLATAVDLDQLARHISESHLQPGATFTILDRNEKVMVRVPSPRDPTGADSIGALAPEGFPGVPDRFEPYIYDGTGLDGFPRLFSVAALRGGGPRLEGYLVIGRDRTRLTTEVDEMVQGELRFLAGTAVVLLILAWVVGHYSIVRGKAA